MQTLLSNITQRIQRIYQKAGDFIEEEREFPISQIFFNATLKKYVTDNVGIIEDLHADLHDDWLRLYATLNVKGMHLVLSVDLKLIQMEMNNETQLIVFEQISNTQVIESDFPSIWMKMAVNSALFFYQRILKKDPLGMILERFEVIQVKDELLLLDLNRWLGNQRSIIETLAKVNINHGKLRETELIVMGNVNLMALFNKVDEDDFDEEIKQQESLRDQENKVTPIQQKSDL